MAGRTYSRNEIRAIRLFSNVAFVIGVLFLMIGVMSLRSEAGGDKEPASAEAAKMPALPEGAQPTPEELAALKKQKEKERDIRGDMSMRYFSAGIAFLVMGGLLRLVVSRVDQPAPAPETWEEESSAFFANPPHQK